jgi:hypothetical protein
VSIEPESTEFACPTLAARYRAVRFPAGGGAYSAPVVLRPTAATENQRFRSLGIASYGFSPIL